MHKIERKYLLNSKITNYLKSKNLQPKQITEFYTVAKICKEIKYSKIENSYYKTEKIGAMNKYNQDIKKVTKNEYNKKIKKKVGNKIKKDRYVFEIKDKTWTIDEYKGKLKKLKILKISFEDLSQYHDFKLPNSMIDYLIKDITKSQRYKNRNLALLGDPNTNSYNIYTIFKDIELARIKNPYTTLFKEMKSSDAIRVVLFSLFIKLRLLREDYIQNRNPNTLLKLSDLLKSSLILLKENQEIFDKKLYTSVKTNLKRTKKYIKNYKELKFIEKNMTLVEDFYEEDEKKSLLKIIKLKKKDQLNAIQRYLSTREFAIIFKQYELLIKENSDSYLSLQAQTSIFEALKEKILIKSKEAIINSNKYEGCFDLKSLQKIKKSFLELNELSFQLNRLSKNSSIDNIFSKSKDILEVTKDLELLYKKRQMVHLYLKNKKEKNDHLSRNIERIEKKIQNQIDKKNLIFLKSIEIFTKL